MHINVPSVFIAKHYSNILIFNFFFNCVLTIKNLYTSGNHFIQVVFGVRLNERKEWETRQEGRGEQMKIAYRRIKNE